MPPAWRLNQAAAAECSDPNQSMGRISKAGAGASCPSLLYWGDVWVAPFTVMKLPALMNYSSALCSPLVTVSLVWLEIQFLRVGESAGWGLRLATAGAWLSRATVKAGLPLYKFFHQQAQNVPITYHCAQGSAVIPIFLVVNGMLAYWCHVTHFIHPGGRLPLRTWKPICKYRLMDFTKKFISEWGNNIPTQINVS